METYDLVVIGSGAAGLSAAVVALKEGIDNVLIIEKDEVLGGNLNLFINDGFGEYYLGEKVTGPELASILIDEYKNLNGMYKLNSRVLDINFNKVITYVNPTEGISEIKAKSIIIASGCREKYTGNIVVPIHKYTGIFSNATAHRLVNLHGYLPGKNIILSGDNIWTAILARRLLVEGANIKAVITDKSNFEENESKILNDFNIPVICKSEIVEVGGTERIEWVKIINRETNELSKIECDSLISSIGYFSEIDFLKKLNIKMKDIALENNQNELNLRGIFLCGTVVNGVKGILNSGEDGFNIGTKVVAYIKDIT